MTSTEISVLVVVYEGDSDSHFRESLQSLVALRPLPNEVVVVKNGRISAHKEQSINELSECVFVESVFIPVNLGLSRALNIGLSRCKCRFVMRHDADDLCVPSRIELFLRALDTSSFVPSVVGFLIDEFVETPSHCQSSRWVPIGYSPLASPFQLIFRNPLNHVTVFLDLWAIEEAVGSRSIYPLIDGFEDYALWIRMRKLGLSAYNVPLTSVLVRLNGDGMLIRRRGLSYYIRELKLRCYMAKSLGAAFIPLVFIVGFVRVLIFSLPVPIVSLFYSRILRRKTLI